MHQDSLVGDDESSSELRQAYVTARKHGKTESMPAVPRGALFVSRSPFKRKTEIVSEGRDGLSLSRLPSREERNPQAETPEPDCYRG